MYIKETDIEIEIKNSIKRFLIDNSAEYSSLKEKKASISKRSNNVYNEGFSNSSVKDLYEKCLAGEITKEQYIVMKDNIYNQKQLVEIYKNEINEINNIKTKLDFFNCLSSGNMEVVVKNYIEKIIVNKNKEISVKFINN